MIAIQFLFSAFFLPPDSEFVEASPAPYSPEELGKSSPFAFSSPNSSREPRVWGRRLTISSRGEGEGAGDASPGSRFFRPGEPAFSRCVCFGVAGEVSDVGCVCVCPGRWCCSEEQGTGNFPTWGLWKSRTHPVWKGAPVAGSA